MRTILSILLIIVFLIGINSCTEMKEKNNPPVAKKIPKKLSIHNDIRIDNYFWLNNRNDPEVIAHLEAENEYTKAVMKNTEALQEKLFEEIKGRIKQTDMSVPFRYNGYYYYTRYEDGFEYPLICRKKGSLEGEEIIMLNVNEMAKGYSFYDLDEWEVSSDNKLIAYSIDTVSRRKYNILIKNLETGEIYPERIKNTDGSVVWANDNKTIFYIRKDKTLRPHKIYSHTVGTDPKNDKLVFHEKDVTYYTSINKTKSEKFLVISSYSTLSAECRILEANHPESKFRIFHKRETDLLYSIDHLHDKFYVLTNDKALNFRLMTTNTSLTSKENWEDMIPHRKDVLLDEFELFDNYMVVSEKKGGLDQLRIIDLKSDNDHYIEFDDPTYVCQIDFNPESNTEKIRYKYSSLTTPGSVYDIDMKTGERILLKRQEVLGDFNPDNYISEWIFATADDGAKIPISLVYRKGIKKDGSNPLWIKAYGAYGYNSDPYFSSVALSLLDRGFVYAIAHIRGGQEMGRQWYEDGKLMKKKNTFSDFIKCTEYLINEGYSNPEKCFAWGGSAGGLLMGAITNMRPDLYKGIIAAVPFVDVITTMLDESIPLTTSEYDEWGNPNDKAYYDYILSYSPYDNVEVKNYPALLVTSGLHDSQVQYWEPAKWVAKLRELKTDHELLLLNTEMDYGHGGASGRFERYKEIALEYAFVFKLLEIQE